MSAHASAAALAARPAMAGKRISAKSVRCAFDRPSRAPFFLPGSLHFFGAFRGENACERLRRIPPCPRRARATMRPRARHLAPGFMRTPSRAHRRGRTLERPRRRAFASDTRGRSDYSPEAPVVLASRLPRTVAILARARVRNVFSSRANRIAPEPLNRVAPLCLRPSLSSPSLLSPGPSLAPPRLLSASPRTLRTTFPTSPSSASASTASAASAAWSCARASSAPTSRSSP